LGWVAEETKVKGRYNLWHNGSNTMNYVEVFIQPDRDVTVVMMINEASALSNKAVAALKERVLEKGLVRDWPEMHVKRRAFVNTRKTT
jgi:hypothetical protein